jgi:hypothetical protein
LLATQFLTSTQNVKVVPDNLAARRIQLRREIRYTSPELPNSVKKLVKEWTDKAGIQTRQLPPVAKENLNKIAPQFLQDHPELSSAQVLTLQDISPNYEGRGLVVRLRFILEHKEFGGWDFDVKVHISELFVPTL